MAYPYQDPTLSVEQRVEDLLGRMTLEEKFAQMRLLRITRQQAHQQPFDVSVLKKDQLGAIYNACSMPPQLGVTYVKALQAQVLFGDADPGGRLPISFPRSAGHIPAYYNHKVSARGFYKTRGSVDNPGRDYVFDTPDALFSFGHGLSYTTFAYSELCMPEQATIGQPVQVCVTVENTGTRTGYEVVQLYVTDCVCRITPFVKQLRGFEKLLLAPGQKQTVQFTLDFEDFAFANEQLQPEVEPGAFRICVGNLQKEIYLQ